MESLLFLEVTASAVKRNPARRAVSACSHYAAASLPLCSGDLNRGNHFTVHRNQAHNSLASPTVLSDLQCLFKVAREPMGAR